MLTVLLAGNHQQSSESIILVVLLALREKVAQFGSFLLDMQMLRVGLLIFVLFESGLAFVGILACVSKEEFMDFTLKIVECSMMLMRKKSQMSGKPVSQHVFIFDLDGFSLKVNN